MGCWNGTCMISNLHILDDEEVVGFVLVQQRNKSRGFCYAHDYFKPAPYLYYGKYNDYGDVKDITTDMTGLLSHVHSAMSKMEGAEIVPADEFDVDKFFEVIHDGEINFLKPWYGPANDSFHHAMVRKDIWDYIFANYEVEIYHGDSTQESLYHKVRFSDWEAGLDEAIDFLVTSFNTLFEAEKTKWLEMEGVTNHQAMQNAVYFACNKAFRPTGGWWDWERDNKSKNFILTRVVASVDRSEMFDWQIRPISERLTTPFVAMMDPNHEVPYETARAEFKQVLLDAAKIVWINWFLEESRKMWHVPTGMGGQGMETNAYKVLMGGMNEVVDAMDRKYGNEDDE